MARPLKPRENYALDIATLQRIAARVRVDDRVSAESRERVVSDLHRAIKGLMKFELESLDAEASAEASADASEESAAASSTPATSQDADDAPPVTIETRERDGETA
jgi:hypothetical protein